MRSMASTEVGRRFLWISTGPRRIRTTYFKTPIKLSVSSIYVCRNKNCQSVILGAR